jgi:cyclomaltodextrinase / maltogenic alpha-amylase / neopullulanase
MSSFMVNAMRAPSGSVLFEAELDPQFPQQVVLVLRGGSGRVEKAMTFFRKAGGRDLFRVTADIAETTEYVLRVNAGGGFHWITPKGEEHGEEPHNWFRCDPQCCAAIAALEMDDWIAAGTTLAEQPASIFEAPSWVRDAVFYQIFPERFSRGAWLQDPSVLEKWGSVPGLNNFMGGNIQGIIDRLGYLNNLGVNALYLAPIFTSPSNHKYDTTDYFQVDPCFGDVALMRELVGKCHERGLRIILDGVFNHCSDQHPFFLDVKCKGRQSRYWNWFNVKRWPIPNSFGKDEQASDWYDCWWGHYSLPKFNHGAQEVEEYFLKVATYWLSNVGIDGWRLDVPNEVLQSFWPKFRRAVKAVNPEAYIVGEIWDDPSAWLQGDRFDGVMNYQFQRALLSYVADEEMNTPTFDRTLHQLLRACPQEASFAMLNLIDSHDTPRAASRVSARNGAQRKLEALKLLASLQFSYPGAPCIYYGDEIGLEGEKDPDCRRCYPWGWDVQSESEGWRLELFNHYKKLIAIRKTNAALRRGDFRTVEADGQRDLYVFERRCADCRCIVAINRSDQNQILALPENVRTLDLFRGRTVHDNLVIVRARQTAVYQLLEQRREAAPAAGRLSLLRNDNREVSKKAA